MSAFKKIIQRWQWCTVVVTVVIAITIMLLPNWLLKWQIKQLELDEVQSIEYIEYNGEPFQSPIKKKKVLALEKDTELLEQYIDIGKKIDDSNKKIYDDCNKVLFFYHKNGNITNAYIEEGLLGFDYGNKWFEVMGIDNMIHNMEKMNMVRVKKNKL